MYTYVAVWGGSLKVIKLNAFFYSQVPEEGVLVKTLYGGICHSDIHFIDDKTDLGEGKSCRNSDVLGNYMFSFFDIE